MTQLRRKIIVLTPIKNEAWILGKFLSATSLWADYIIVADQYSTDESREIASKYNKVILIENKSKEFNEPERQRLLINKAREIDDSAILFALDADEFVAGSAIENGEIEKLRYLEPRTVIRFHCPFISSDFSYYFGNMLRQPFAYVDDGAEHEGQEIHSVRVPVPKDGKNFQAKNIPVMHFQFTDWNRMESKHRWYQCYERSEFPNKSIVKIFRMYSHMYRVSKHKKTSVPDTYFNFYLKNKIDLKEVIKQDFYYWDDKVSEIVENNPKFYKNIDLPNNDSYILKYLRKTKTSNNIFIKVFDRFLSLII